MYENIVKEYVGKKVVLILSNGFKLTTTLPNEIKQTFNIIDKFDHRSTINCCDITSIVEVGDSQ